MPTLPSRSAKPSRRAPLRQHLTSGRRRRVLRHVVAGLALIGSLSASAASAQSEGSPEHEHDAETVVAESRNEGSHDESAAFSTSSADGLPAGDALLPRPHGAAVYVDPVTGELTDRATPAQRAALRLAQLMLEQRQQDQRRIGDPGRTPPGANIRYFAVPGGVGAYLDGAFQSSLRVHRASDGSLHFDCTENHPTEEQSNDTSSPTAVSRPHATLEEAPVQ